MTEFELIERYFRRPTPGALVGNGDDCAVIAPSPGQAFAVTTDTLIEGRHFLPGLAPHALGRRAVAVNFSDLAAMGAAPRYALLSLTLPALDADWLQAFSAGLWSALDAHDVGLIGGNTTRGPLAITVTVFGEVPPGQALLRSGAQVGDELWVSGPLGDAGWALHGLLGEHDQPLSAGQIARYEAPVARVALGLTLRGVASSCIDISDGLLSEANHIAQASGVAIEIDFAALPHHLQGPLADPQLRARALHCLLNTGDAYELLFTAPAAQHAAVQAALRQTGLPGACVGRVRALTTQTAARVQVLDAQGQVMPVSAAGWDHFAAERHD